MAFRPCMFCNVATYEIPAQKGHRPCESCRERKAALNVIYLAQLAYFREEVSIGFVSETLGVSIEEAQRLMLEDANPVTPRP